MSGSEEVQSARLMGNGREALKMGRDEVQKMPGIFGLMFDGGGGQDRITCLPLAAT